MAYLTIDGKACNGIALPEPAHGGIQVSIQDVDSASTGRGADGNMIRDRVGVKAKINLKFPPLTQAEVAALLDAVDDVSFTVTYPDPRKSPPNYTSTGTFYVGDRTVPIYKTGLNGVELWENCAFNLIEM